MPAAPPFPETLAIVGVGLLGGSIGLAIRERGLARRVIGIGRNPARLAAAQDAGVIDEFSTDIRAAANADLTILCTPVDRIAADAEQVAAAIRPGALITDVGSVKGTICRAVEKSSAGPRFIGSHPLAGSEQQGWEHAAATLFEGRVCVLTPTESSREAEIARLEQFWKGLGLRTVRMTPEQHDETLALTSHLPHLAASALALLLPEAARPFAATGFRDTTRIAAGDPDLWTPIFLANAAGVTPQIDRLLDVLRRLRTVIEEGDGAALQELLAAARASRQSLDG